MKNFKWHIAIIACILTLSVAVGGLYLRQRQMVDEPLLKRINAYQGVETVELIQQNNEYIILVKLGLVDDLSIVHREIDEEIRKLLGGKRYRLVIIDERDETLEAVFLRIHLGLFEAESRGNFTNMGERVNEIVEEFKLEKDKLVVDKEYIYFQAAKGQNYMYIIIERNCSGEEGDRT